MYVLESELRKEEALHRLARRALLESNLLLAGSQREVARLEGERRELLDRIAGLEAIIATLTAAPY